MMIVEKNDAADAVHILAIVRILAIVIMNANGISVAKNAVDGTYI